MQHLAVSLVDLLLDQVTAVRAGLYHPRNFEYHLVRVWLGGYEKCHVPFAADEVHAFFSPPVAGAGVPWGPEACRDFQKIQEWMRPVIEEARREKLTNELDQDNLHEIMYRTIVTHLARHGTPFPDDLAHSLPEIMSDAHSDGDDNW
jgi:hypothetical protein